MARPLLTAMIERDEGQLGDVVFANVPYAWFGLLVALAIAAYVWGAHRRRQAVERLGNPILLARLLASVDSGKRLIRALCVCLALSAVVLGLMRVQYGGVAKVVPARGLDIVLAVDYSKSMLAEDVYPSRSERLEAELTRFLDESGRRGDRVGVVVFAGGARSFPVTADLAVLDLFLRHADPRTENPGGTAIGKALDKAIDLLIAVRREDAIARGELDPEEDDEDARAEQLEELANEADQIIILLTDGEDTVGRPLELAQRANQLGIKIYAVGIGSDLGEPIMKYDAEGQPIGYATDDEGKPIVTRLDEETLEQLADATQGEYVHVEPESFGLDEVREEVEDLSAAQREQSIEIHREEGFVFFLVPAVVLLSIGLALGDRRRRARGSGDRTEHLAGRSRS